MRYHTEHEYKMLNIISFFDCITFRAHNNMLYILLICIVYRFNKYRLNNVPLNAYYERINNIILPQYHGLK